MTARFTVAYVPGVAPARWARVWADRMPDVELRLLPVAATDVVRVLTPGDGPVIDMAFARLPIADVGLTAIPLWEETPVAVAAKDHPLKVVDAVTLAELADEDTVDGQDETALDLVAAGAGIARMPQAVFRGHNRRDLVARPITDAEPTRIALVWRAGPQSELVDEFIGIVRGRTAASSRGRQADAETQDAVPEARAGKPAAGGKPGAGRRPSAGGKPTAGGGKAARGGTPGKGGQKPRGKSTGTRKPHRPGGGRGR